MQVFAHMAHQGTHRSPHGRDLVCRGSNPGSRLIWHAVDSSFSTFLVLFFFSDIATCSCLFLTREDCIHFCCTCDAPLTPTPSARPPPHYEFRQGVSTIHAPENFPHHRQVGISLWDVRFPANTERFQGLVPLWSNFCPLSVRLGGLCGVYSESP